MKNVENATDLCPQLENFKIYMLEHDLHEETRTGHDIEEISLDLHSLEVSEDEEGLDSEIMTHILVCICSLLSREFMFTSFILFLLQLLLVVLLSLLLP